MDCPVCDYPHVKPYYRMRDRFFETSRDEFLLYRCSSCGLLFQNEEEIRTRLPEFYPRGYWWDENGAPSSGLEKKYREWMVKRDQLQFLLSVVPDPKNCRLLDVGCGNGTFVKLALQAGFDAFGLEQADEAARIAERESPGRIFDGSRRDLVSGAEKFDVLTLFHLLEHVPSPLGYLKDLHKLLHRPGKIIIQVPNNESFQARIFGSRWYGLDCPRHVCNYSTDSLMHLVARAGFRTHRVRHFSLRDNAAALISSAFPSLDPMSQRVKVMRKKGQAHSLGLTVKQLLYFHLLVLAQPLAFLEASVSRGATVALYATLDRPIIPRA